MILLDRVTKTYPGDEDPVLDNISLHIDPHEFVFLVGKSGAGKSTLIKMITKEENPDSGKIIVGGIDLDFVKHRHIPHYRRRLGVVFQDYKLLPTRTVFENVAFALEIAGMSNREIQKTVPKVLDLVGLENKASKFPTHLSGGERQRVSIARSVARQPKILIADEPTGNLDKLTRKEIIDLLQKINDFGTTLLVTTHDENIVNNLRKRVVTLKGGRIINDQKVDGVYRLGDESERSLASPTKEPDFHIVTTPIIEKIYSPFLARKKKSTEAKTAPATSKPQTATTKLAPRPSTSKPSPRHVNDVQKKTPQKQVATQKSTPKPTSSKPAATPQPDASQKSLTPPQPSTPSKKYARDSANQWYAASKPLRAAPKLSKLASGQTVKLKPAPSIKQVTHPTNNKPRPKRIV